MSSQLSYRLHGREQRPKTLRKHNRDELDTGQVKASAKEPRACSARRLMMGRSQCSARASTASSGAVCTENSVRIDSVIESPNVGDDGRAIVLLADAVGLAIQVEGPTCGRERCATASIERAAA